MSDTPHTPPAADPHGIAALVSQFQHMHRHQKAIEGELLRTMFNITDRDLAPGQEPIYDRRIHTAIDLALWQLQGNLRQLQLIIKLLRASQQQAPATLEEFDRMISLEDPADAR